MVCKGTKLSEQVKQKVRKGVLKYIKEHPKEFWEAHKRSRKTYKKLMKSAKGKKINKIRSKKLMGIKRKPFTEEHIDKIRQATKKQYQTMFPWGKGKSSKVHLKLKKKLPKRFQSEQFVRLKDIGKWTCIDELDRENKIAVFVDGEHWHAKNYADDFIVKPRGITAKEIREYDASITKSLQKKGYKVFRVWAYQIENNLDSCIQKILV